MLHTQIGGEQGLRTLGKKDIPHPFPFSQHPYPQHLLLDILFSDGAQLTDSATRIVEQAEHKLVARRGEIVPREAEQACHLTGSQNGWQVTFMAMDTDESKRIGRTHFRFTVAS